MIYRVKIGKYERGLLYRDGDFVRVLRPGRHWIVDPLLRTEVITRSVRERWLIAVDLEVLVRSGELSDETVVLDLKDHERALVWVDGRYAELLGPGLYAAWAVEREVRVEVIDARTRRLDHTALPLILAQDASARWLATFQVPEGCTGVLTIDGKVDSLVKPGRYAYWRGEQSVTMPVVDLREQQLEIAGQELMTADRVTLRLNALVVYRIVDVMRSIGVVENVGCRLPSPAWKTVARRSSRCGLRSAPWRSTRSSKREARSSIRCGNSSVIARRRWASRSHGSA